MRDMPANWQASACVISPRLYRFRANSTLTRAAVSDDDAASDDDTKLLSFLGNPVIVDYTQGGIYHSATYQDTVASAARSGTYR